MIKLGEIQSLKISRMASVGAYLFSEDYPKEEILLPLSQVLGKAREIILMYLYIGL